MSNLIIENFVIRTDDAGRYSLNDLHKAAGGEAKHQPSNWLRLEQTQELIVEIDRSSDLRNAIISVATIQGWVSQGTYVCKELEYIAQRISDRLSLPQSGYIAMLHRGMRVVAPELLPMLPSYSIDTSPVGLVTTGSSKPTFALTTLLKRHNLPYSAVGFNRLLVSAGVLIDTFMELVDKVTQ